MVVSSRCSIVVEHTMCELCMKDSNLPTVICENTRRDLGKKKLELHKTKSLCGIGLQRNFDGSAVKEEGYENVHDLAVQQVCIYFYSKPSKLSKPRSIDYWSSAAVGGGGGVGGERGP